MGSDLEGRVEMLTTLPELGARLWVIRTCFNIMEV
jgi:hypothetical protein